MRQLNFVLLFVGGIAIAFFAMQNASPVTVTFWPGVGVASPLVVELLAAAGLGAAIAWVFSLWSSMQFQLDFNKQVKEIAARDNRIDELKQLVVELETTVQQLPPSKRAEPTTTIDSDA